MNDIHKEVDIYVEKYHVLSMHLNVRGVGFIHPMNRQPLPGRQNG